MISGGVAGAIVGLGLSFVLPWRQGPIATVDITTVVNLALQSLFLLAGYLAVLGAAYGFAAGLLAGFAYPLVRRLPSTAASVVAHAVLGGVLVSALWFLSSALPVTFVDPGGLGFRITSTAGLGAMYTLLSIPLLLYLVYRRPTA